MLPVAAVVTEIILRVVLGGSWYWWCMVEDNLQFARAGNAVKGGTGAGGGGGGAHPGVASGGGGHGSGGVVIIAYPNDKYLKT